MPVIVVANPKGGVGKSTLATNVAGLFAAQGYPTMLGDVDRQQSSRLWLGLRPESAAPIAPWDLARNDLAKPPKGTGRSTCAVLDSPAGLHGRKLEEVLKLADKVLVPLQPSIFDIHATHDFVAELLAFKQEHKRGDRLRIGIVGMRAREGTLSVDQLKSFLGTLDVPVLGFLRDTQNYVHLAAHGLTLWDVAASRVDRDLEQWAPIAEWLLA